MIPKKIHYCWFGGNPLPPLAEKCIASWKQYCPDYEIVAWDESNFDVEGCQYIKEAYHAKKWAFVSDYARYKILYEHGGIYFDTDVELIKPIDDILERGNFMGCENERMDVATGLGLAMTPKHPILAELLEDYEKSTFIKPDGSFNLTTIVERTTNLFKRYGLKQTREVQEICGIYIYPKEYFCPLAFETKKMTMTNNTRSIHHFDGSWMPEESRYLFSLMADFSRFLPEKLAMHAATFITLIKYEGTNKAFRETIRWIIRR